VGKTRKSFYHKERGLRITRLMARDGSSCMLCGEPLDRHIKDESHDMYITFDHIKPSSKRGTDELANKQLAHRICNEERGNNPIMPENEA